LYGFSCHQQYTIDGSTSLFVFNRNTLTFEKTLTILDCIEGAVEALSDAEFNAGCHLMIQAMGVPMVYNEVCADPRIVEVTLSDADDIKITTMLYAKIAKENQL
jgi:hypothetical protein